LCEAGRFRDDLLYRLKLMYIRVPPLRERVGDAAPLAHHFVALASRRFGKPAKPIGAATLDWFDRYAWPGNVRELEHLIYREFLMLDGPEIEIAAPAALAVRPFVQDLTYREAKAAAIEAFERQYLTTLMARADGRVSVAARMVRTERRHLGRLLKRYQIAADRIRA
jgi:two-component system response regulator GlrR